MGWLARHGMGEDDGVHTVDKAGKCIDSLSDVMRDNVVFFAETTAYFISTHTHPITPLPKLHTHLTALVTSPQCGSKLALG